MASDLLYLNLVKWFRSPRVWDETWCVVLLSCVISSAGASFNGIVSLWFFCGSPVCWHHFSRSSDSFISNEIIIYIFKTILLDI